MMARVRHVVWVSFALAAVLAVVSAFSSDPVRALSFALFAMLIGLGLGLWLPFAIRTRRSAQKDDDVPTTSEFPVDLLIATLNEMREGLLVIDGDMRVVASNHAARHVFSNVEGSLNSKRLTELTRNPTIYEAFLEGVRGVERAGVKVEIFAPGRQVFDLRVVPLHIESGIDGAVGVFFDVTKLERLELIRQEFLSNVSHELRTPLTSIVALAETLEVGAIDDPQNNRRFVSIIQKNAARMHRLIDDILELSAIEAGNVKIQPEMIKLHSLVEDVVNSISPTSLAQDVAVRNLIPPHVIVFADPHRLTQMLTNLIDNAIKFNRNNGSVSIAFCRDEYDQISVEDSGEGIPSHQLDRLFERFYRVDRARSRELGGTGLGLAIVKHLARAHGGEVRVESTVGVGSRFTVGLPRVEQHTRADGRHDELVR